MTDSNKRVIFYVIITILVVLFLDQSSKIWIKMNMHYGQEFLIFGQDWARFHFVENEGMAYGISLGGKTGKLFLSLFRLGAIGFLIYLLVKLIREKYEIGLKLQVAKYDNRLELQFT